RLREVSRALEHGRDYTQVGGAFDIAEAFPACQEEGAVVAVVELRNHDRPSERRAELVAPQLTLAGVEKIARVEEIVAEVFEHGAVRLIAAALENHADDTAGETAVFGRVAGGVQLELL